MIDSECNLKTIYQRSASSSNPLVLALEKILTMPSVSGMHMFITKNDSSLCSISSLRVALSGGTVSKVLIRSVNEDRGMGLDPLLLVCSGLVAKFDLNHDCR